MHGGRAAGEAPQGDGRLGRRRDGRRGLLPAGAARLGERRQVDAWRIAALALPTDATAILAAERAAGREEMRKVVKLMVGDKHIRSEIDMPTAREIQREIDPQCFRYADRAAPWR